jgi:hypothetical protein
MINTNFIQPKKKTSGVVGVTGVDFDSDEEKEKKGRYGKKAKKDNDDDDFERDESLTLDELDGWMEKVSKERKESLENEKK